MLFGAPTGYNGVSRDQVCLDQPNLIYVIKRFLFKKLKQHEYKL